MTPVYVFIIVIVLVVIWAIGTYNRLVVMRNRVDNGWSQIDVQLRRRYDLIPNLVETVKGYAAHEKETFEMVTKARQAGIDASSVADSAAAENMISQALKRLFAVAEAYPQLRGDGELPATPGRANLDRRQDRLLPPVLQRHRDDVQPTPASLPRQHHCRHGRLSAAGLLQDRRRSSRPGEGAVLE